MSTISQQLSACGEHAPITVVVPLHAPYLLHFERFFSSGARLSDWPTLKWIVVTTVAAEMQLLHRFRKRCYEWFETSLPPNMFHGTSPVAGALPQLGCLGVTSLEHLIRATYSPARATSVLGTVLSKRFDKASLLESKTALVAREVRSPWVLRVDADSVFVRSANLTAFVLSRAVTGSKLVYESFPAARGCRSSSSWIENRAQYKHQCLRDEANALLGLSDKRFFGSDFTAPEPAHARLEND